MGIQIGMGIGMGVGMEIVCNIRDTGVLNCINFIAGTDSKVKRPGSQCGYQCVGCNWRTCPGKYLQVEIVS